MKVSLNLKSLKTRVTKLIKFSAKHAIFTTLILVLLIYIWVVWQISQLATAEPTPEAENTALASTNIPKVDKKAVEQIQALEKGNTEIQSLFNSARNNPFKE